MPFISVSAPSIVSGMSGESEKTLRETFEETKVCTVLPLRMTKIHEIRCVAVSALAVIH